jgi:hypothetical protein
LPQGETLKKETINKLEDLLDTSLEHFLYGWRALEKKGMVTYKDPDVFPPSVSDRPTSASYHFAAIAHAVKRAHEIIAAEQCVQRMGLLARISKWVGEIAHR